MKRLLLFLFTTHCVYAGVVSTTSSRWNRPEQACIYADYDPSFVAGGRAGEFIQAFSELNSRTRGCFELRPWQEVPEDQQFIYFVPSNGCSSQLGRSTCTYQTIQIAPGCRVGAIMHEVMHALGAMHEHQRSDRNEYVTVFTNNVNLTPAGISVNFGIYANSLVIGDYDYNSIMHYGGTAFTKVAGTLTIQTLDPTKQGVIGQRTTLSAGDVQTINFLLDVSDPEPGNERPPAAVCRQFAPFVNQTVPVVMYE